VFEIVWTEGGDPKQIVEESGLKQVTDTGAIEAAVDEVIAANPDKVKQAHQKAQLAGWFVGQVMKATGGKANPAGRNRLACPRGCPTSCRGAKSVGCGPEMKPSN
jgi:aspartyl-tRNA(Asn)/glutamyl-tRNA(Gln) amidotransferase subunit B